jgi:hypothetical protein
MNYMSMRAHELNGPFMVTIIRQRVQEGKVIIISQKPTGTMSVIRRAWNKHIRSQKRQFSATLNTQRRHEIANDIRRMEAVSFSCASVNKCLGKDVIAASKEGASFHLPHSATLIIVSGANEHEIYEFTSLMPQQGWVILSRH